MKYTLLPPQKVPKQVTARHGVPNLGEHRQAFMNLHNQRGWVAEPTPEQPESDAMMALAATLLLSNRKASKPKRAKVLKVEQLHQQLIPRGKPANVDSDIFRQPVKSIVIPDSPMHEYMSTMGGRRNTIKMYDVASPLSDAEFVARRKLLLGDPSVEEYVKAINEVIDRHHKFRKHLHGTHMHVSLRAMIEQIIPPLNNNLIEGIE